MVYKLIKVLLCASGAIAAMHLRERNLVALATHWFAHRGLNPEGKICAGLLARLAKVQGRDLRLLSYVLMLYTLMYLVEAVGLYLEKRWVEWFTVIQTSLIIPFEIYALWLRSEPAKWAILASSVITVAYLLVRIRRDKAFEQAQRRRLVSAAP